ncbi:hypothetical protein ACSSS7_004967 [Eimeria intestinalis]
MSTANEATARSGARRSSSATRPRILGRAYRGRRQTVASVEAGGNDDGVGGRLGRDPQPRQGRGGQGMETPPQAAEQADGIEPSDLRIMFSGSARSCAEGCVGRLRRAKEFKRVPRRNGAVLHQRVAPALPVDLNEARAACCGRLRSNTIGGGKGVALGRRAAARAFGVRPAEGGKCRAASQAVAHAAATEADAAGGLHSRREAGCIAAAGILARTVYFEALPQKGGDAVQVVLESRPAVACNHGDLHTEATRHVCQVGGDRRFLDASRRRPEALAHLQLRVVAGRDVEV